MVVCGIWCLTGWSGAWMDGCCIILHCIGMGFLEGGYEDAYLLAGLLAYSTSRFVEVRWGGLHLRRTVGGEG